ncbi:MAG: hypothetical protein J5I94_14405 [Phaeodactylibacter sp.]|nr:hypothetical protein [Phaeodactylibacter sp.]
MPELSKHELDKLFRKGAERYDFEYNPGAWEQMSAMLERSRRRRALFWWLAGLGMLLLLGGLAFYFFCEEEGAVKKKEKQEQALTEPIEGEMKSHEKENSDVYSPKGSREEAPQAGPEPGTEYSESRPEKQFQAQRPVPGVVEIPGPSTEAQAAHTGPAVSRPEKEPETPKFTGTELAKTLPPLPLPFTLDPIQVYGPKGPGAPGIIAGEHEESHRKRSNHLAIGPGFAGNLHSVGWGDFSRGGWKAGIYSEFQYQGRFALGLGAGFLRMNYLAGKGEYMPPYGFWANMTAPDNTLGLCNVLEVPVLLKYYPGGYYGNGFFLSAGISSYILLMEEYWYRYSEEDPDLIRWWQTGEDQAHWFAIGQLSAGYQASMGKRWALQLGPYLQAPLSGVGHGQVEIYSLGVNIQLLWKVW